MKIKCEYCGENINDYDLYCQYCKKPNLHYKKTTEHNKIPETIDELKQWYIDRNLPPETTTRFFIGTNYRGARAFGIYQDDETGDFVVYKNKSDGSRAIRYQGKNEKYAVNELYLKLKEEIANQKANNGHSSYNRETKKYYHTSNLTVTKLTIAVLILLIVIGFIPTLIGLSLPKRGYYLYHGDYYYYQNGSWYGYNNRSGWNHATVTNDLKNNYRDYYKSYSYSSYYNIGDFEYSGYYVEPSYSSSSSSWDSSSDWDSSDSWDSGSTDWDSDW